MTATRPPVDPASVFDWVDVRSAARARAGLTRRLRPRPATTGLLDLASNDYLGLARHPLVCAAAADAAQRWGAGATGSRLVTGTTELHADLEAELAAFCGVEAALVFSSGWAANLGALAALSGPGTLVVADAFNHASLIDGCRLARGETEVVPHVDPAAVRAALAGRTRRRALVVTDAVFSVDGDLAPLPEIAAAAREHGAGLVVDDAHGLGVVGEGGRGSVADAGLAGAPDVVVTTTLSKSLGSQGGAVLGPRRVIDHLVDTARSFIFDTGLAPAAVAGALAALRLVRERPELPDRARTVARELAARLRSAGLDASEPSAAVVSVRAPSPQAAVDWAAACRAEGVAVGCFRPPSVPDRFSRLRLTARADLTPAEIDLAVDVLARTAPPTVTR
ncbi:8-amino-7-oxononanoate synthase [Streptoalloteichus tenebrarius]|uniref:8-amino-7-oxononanoate synthase n=1 Tax=Streptoalloteichus tenebrarius (strain ATCC 17920 / DSM 40477 / JCM 4838 / CBS 697.72 / NBRC 16177 / NCIMB 11028 / NRRL B-12390 / A12253. 1 / ISP 5477) TaxID=1933 RepID=A0ABT1HMD8_STRSD|nr:8-amino-7-oxononanoate synthase [Streptoalloteichus tenebrarius]MCP2256682.1 8-amino-7-oxononanoate synthase [Streptoalloteichus tenebrarius]BFF00419.1 8-amino-7-oxononanoate synthase [Streptoalloteichus tenebrarius]